MYFVKLQFIISVLSLLVIAENDWYPAYIAPMFTPYFDGPDKLKTNDVRVNENDFNTNRTINHSEYKSNWSVTNNTKQSIHLKYNWPRPTFNRLNGISSDNDDSRITLVANAMEYNQTNATDLDNNRKDFNNTKRRIIGENDFKMTLSRIKMTTTKAKSKPRFLDVFQVVEFEHVLCTSASGLEGRCLHHYDCETIGGSSMGSCADGYGICCVSKYF